MFDNEKTKQVSNNQTTKQQNTTSNVDQKPVFYSNNNKTNPEIKTEVNNQSSNNNELRKPDFKPDNSKKSNNDEKPKDAFVESLKDTNKYTSKTEKNKDQTNNQSVPVKKEEDIEKPNFNPSGKSWEGKSLENNDDVSINYLVIFKKLNRKRT